MRAGEVCGLAADLAPADAALSGDCPSALCAGALVTMLTDCAETVEHGQVRKTPSWPRSWANFILL